MPPGPEIYSTSYILVNETLMLYDTDKGAFEELMKMPGGANQLVGPSLKGRFVFGMGVGSLSLADTKNKKIIPINFPPQNLTWLTDDVMLMSRDIMDTQYRGSWVQPIESPDAVRVSTEPYSFDRTSGESSVVVLEEAKALFGTNAGLLRMNLDGSNVCMLTPLSGPVAKFLQIKKWPASPQ